MSSRTLLAFVSPALLGLTALAAQGQTAPNNWTWVSGSNSIPTCSNTDECGRPGVYGTLGKFAAGNIPSARQGAATWTGAGGEFWLFGGYGNDSTGNYGYLNDLWEYNPATKQWAWMGGSMAVPATCTNATGCGQSGVYGTRGAAASGNIPGARYGAAAWADASGNLWMFGGIGFDHAGNNGDLNDVWEFSVSSGEWTWKGGGNSAQQDEGNDILRTPGGVYGTRGVASASNIPGGRWGASAWLSSNGNVWLFGGYGNDLLGNAGTLNDLWEFDPANGDWTWVSGSSEISAVRIGGVYGTLGEPNEANCPGPRQGAVSWIDGSGNLWLFGGWGWDENGVSSFQNDLWEFSPTSGEWTWQGGNSTWSGSAVYGELGTFAAANLPPRRSDAMAWKDSKGNFWLFGGSSTSSGPNPLPYGYMTDAWEYNAADKEWAWMGVTIKDCLGCSPKGVYGTEGTASAANYPGGRVDAAIWKDSKGNVWLFGGGGYDANGNHGYLNDFWEYAAATGTPEAKTPTVTVTPSPGSITITDALSVHVTVSGSSGTPAGTVTLLGGGYLSAVTALSAGSATISVPKNSLLPAVDTLTAYYAPNAASAATYTAAQGSNTVDIASTGIAAPTVYVNPAEYSIWTNEALPVTVYVSGNGAGLPTGTVTLTGGTFTESLVLGGAIDSQTAGHFEIPEGSLPAGTDTLTATYKPDANSSESYSSAKGTATLVVNVHPASEMDWTWVGGDSILSGDNDQYGVYGKKGTAAPANFPGGRYGSSSWTDSSGNFWLFGGRGNDSWVHGVEMNDLWKYAPATNEWTWVAGDSASVLDEKTGFYNTAPVYGTEGVFAAGNEPGGRSGASSWIDSAGHLWLFGGLGEDANNSAGQMNDLWEFNPALGQWAWISGLGYNGQPGVYGTKGVAAAANVPAARQNAVSWIDHSGNLWLFGGYAQDSSGPYGDCYINSLNDLWMFNPTTKEWTWEGGSAPTYINGCDDFGKAPPTGVYGTKGVASASNIPAAVMGAVGWTDSKGNFWLFGGEENWIGYSQGTVDALWEFNPTTKEWTWVRGSNTINTYNLAPNESPVYGQAGVYGTLGVAAAANTPGSRTDAFTWTDKQGNFWLMGGSGLDSSGIPGWMNDLWEFNVTSREWTWWGGMKMFPSPFGYDGPLGNYGELGVPNSGNIPGGRHAGASWTDSSGHLWLFGGNGWDGSGQDGWLNDLWEFRPPITPTVTVTPSPASITKTQALSVKVSVKGGTGDPTPAGTVKLASGSYVSTATTLTGGSATISVPAGSLAVGTDTLTVTYTPFASSSPTYGAATGKNTVSVTP